MVDDRQQNMTKTGTNVQYDAALDPVLDGAFDGPCHRYPLRVHYEDTDAGGLSIMPNILLLPNARDQHGFVVLGLISQRCL